jgi:hypothetical protein
MKRILFLGLIALVGTAFICMGAYLYVMWMPVINSALVTSTAVARPKPLALKNLPDIDVLAARMKHDQDVYQRIRDEILAVYAKRHPVAQPYDDEARMALRLIAYLTVWNDYYGEGLWQQYDIHSIHLQNEGCHDPVFPIICEVFEFKDAYSN